MSLPAVEILPSDTIHQADEKVEKAFEALGIPLVAFENLNSTAFQPTADVCHFFQVETEGSEHVLVVKVGAWKEPVILTVLNILLEMRLDPDPPGARLRFAFYAAEAVPDILTALFSDSPASQFECRACVVARFGHEVGPDNCQQLAAVAVSLSREHFHRLVSLVNGSGGEGTSMLEEITAVCADLHDARLAVEPLNSLITIGCLFGEVLRGQIGYPSRWGSLPQSSPWPILAFAARPGTGDRSHPEGQRVVFNPIATMLRFFQNLATDRDYLKTATRELARRCAGAFGS